VLDAQSPIRFSAAEKPKLIVVIDTEEEFDWSSEPSREANSVSAMTQIGRVQSIFDDYSLVPCYVVDYPVISNQQGYEVLQEIHARGGCEIGAHLHPWVNPPYEESLSRYNTFPGNLPKHQEMTKLKILAAAIEEVFGLQVNIYKAGRYGVGPNTAEVLEALDFEVDLSVCPPVNYASEGGPDFSRFAAEPYWFADNKILEIPLTGAFVGWAGNMSRPLYSLANKLKGLKAPAILSRLSAVDRLMLSPEGFQTEDHIKITKFLYEKGVRTFTWSFHSPSVMPGCTPYVKTEKDLQHFLDMFRRYFDFFFAELAGEACTPTMLRRQLERNE
jgi:hypothetical protein